jgi:hypothetical protein
MLLGVFLKRAIFIVLVFALLSMVCFPATVAYSFPLVGSKGSTVYHYSDCPSAQNIKPENLKTFIDAQDAVNQGYHPCERCNPPLPGSTIAPTAKPTPTPTQSATSKPTENPTVTTKPTTSPTPTLAPSPTPTATQTSQPTATPTSNPTPTSQPTSTPTSIPTTTDTPGAISPIDPTPQPQIISQSPEPSVPEFGILSLLLVSALATVVLLYLKKATTKQAIPPAQITF